MKDSWVKPVRTVIQCLIWLVPAVPLLVPQLGLSATAGLGASLIAVSAAASKVMTIPAIESILEKLGLHSR